jgi:3-methylcrotonyl-CoA carboxylase beta subunit
VTVLRSAANPGSEEFRANQDANEALVADLRDQLERVAGGGGERARERHMGRGKLLPRERVDRLLDPGAPFLELSAPTACMTTKPPARGSSPESAVSPGASA